MIARALTLGLWFLTAIALHAQQGPCPLQGTEPHADRCVYFTMERFGVMVPVYTVAVRADGKLKYWENADPHSGVSVRAPWLALSEASTKTIFAAEEPVRSGACMSHVRAMGFGGKATMIAWGTNGAATCSFVSSSDASVSAASTTLQAIAEMLQGTVQHDVDRPGRVLRIALQLREVEARASRTLIARARR